MIGMNHVFLYLRDYINYWIVNAALNNNFEDYGAIEVYDVFTPASRIA